MTGKICVSISASSTEEMLSRVAGVGSGADMVELRLDAMDAVAVAPFIENIDRPMLFTNRASWEGGGFSGPEEERIAPLVDAVAAGAWVDIELFAPEVGRGVITAAATASSRVIVSWHDFDSTPEHSDLEDILVRQMDSGADIGKMVTMARGPGDVLRLLSMLEIAAAADFPLCAFCMGDAGRISRVATLALGGFMTYAAPDSGETTAPGQLTLAAMLRIMGELS